MFSINKSSNTAFFLALCNYMLSKGSFSGTFRPVNFNLSPRRIMEPLPKSFSIFSIANFNALFLSSLTLVSGACESFTAIYFPLIPKRKLLFSYKILMQLVYNYSVHFSVDILLCSSQQFFVLKFRYQFCSGLTLQQHHPYLQVFHL